MSKRIILGVFLGLVLVPGLVFAGTFEAREKWLLSSDEVVDDNLYVAGADISLSGDVRGDLVAAGGKVLVNGDIGRDAALAGGQVDVLSFIAGDLRVIGGEVLVNNEVRGDLVVAGGDVRVSSETQVGRDTALAGGLVEFNGAANGDVKIAAGEIHVNGSVAGDTTLHAGERVVIGEGAVLVGTLVYSAPTEIEILEGALIQGEIIKTDAPFGGKEREDTGGFFAGLLGMFFVVKVLSLLIAGLLFVILFKRFSASYIGRTYTHFGKEVVRGLAVLVVTPVLIIILLTTVVGALLGLILGVVYATLFLCAAVYGGILFGSILQRRLFKQDEVNWTTAVLGIILLAIVKLIPLVGWLIAFVIFLAALGGLTNTLYMRMWERHTS